MLCDLMEDGEVMFAMYSIKYEIFSMQETCYQYWPMSGMVQFGEYAIDLMEEHAVTGFTIRKISIYDVKV